MGKIIGIIGFAALVAALSYVGLTAGYRLDLLTLGQVFTYMKPLSFALLGAGGLAVLFALIGFFVGRAGTAFFTLLMGVASLGAASGPLMMKQQAAKVPAIHDITTDTKFVPQFVALVEIRNADGASNPVTYDPAIAEQQLKAYPRVKPSYYDLPYAEVFKAAKATIQEMGLEVVAIDDAAGRIEATHTSMWWGYKDDVVVKVNRFTSPIEVNIRSKSRVGRSDLGANAKRIETFLDKLDAKLK